MWSKMAKIRWGTLVYRSGALLNLYAITFDAS